MVIKWRTNITNDPFTYENFEYWITYNSFNLGLDHFKRSSDCGRVIFYNSFESHSKVKTTQK